MRVIAGLLGLLIVLCCPAVLSENKLEIGLKNYKLGQYSLALVAFREVAVGTGPAATAAHCYLADCYYRLGKLNDAISEYEIVSQLDPAGQYGAYAKQALTMVKGALDTSDTAENTVVIGRSASSWTSTNAEPTFVADIKAKLPMITKEEDEKPAFAEVAGWADSDKINYIDSAQDRVSRATERLENAKALKQKAESICHSMVQSSKKYGESELARQKQIEKSKEKMQELLKPYDNLVEHCEKEMERQQNLLTACQTALLRATGYTK